MRGSAPPPPDAVRPGRARGRRLGAVGAVVSAALLVPLPPAGAAGAGQQRPESLQQAFARAAEEYRVPRSVLLGVAYLQSRWDAHGGAPSVVGGYGPMHLTDAAAALAAAPHHGDGREDPRGDGARPLFSPVAPLSPGLAGAGGTPWRSARPALPSPVPERLRTLERAARLTGIPARALRQDPAANVRGGAALLADAQRRLGLPPSADPADWYGAVAGYPGASDAATARTFARDVFEVIRSGQRRTTDAGQRVVLPASPRLAARPEQVRRLGLRAPSAAGVECPASVACESIPAPYRKLEGTDYGNHDVADRPRSQKVRFIVVHDTEGSWETTVRLIQDPRYVSWNYTVRSADGHIAQHVPTKDVAWHAGNWYVNSASVGIEHEGFLAEPDAWYTEEMYRTSARLVRYLAQKLDVPLDRQHILGHDNVPGTLPSTIPGMHTDPGPYWDWAHYFELLDRPFQSASRAFGGLVTVLPDYDENRPPYTGCKEPGAPCDGHGSGAVRLRTGPGERYPLVKDIGLRPDGGESTTDVNDTGARASTGQQFAVAGRENGWTAIWYLGQKAWFADPWERPASVPARGSVVTPRPGQRQVPVYGRAYPEKAAYPAGVPVQEVTPLPYRLPAGQRYALGQRVVGEYLWAKTFDPAGHRLVRGKDVYYEIQFGHRVAFVRAADVEVLPPGR
ncbi:N-acetylmuramoyl-L-alanine amidase [Streptomyces gamaensis]|uniref:N-acetylmuramoyl-L-alanine amidase n=1 Tax=Streptomyces gamaensis TaxID=1763542 RepID=A0ABW0Z4T5_9ACTN